MSNVYNFQAGMTEREIVCEYEGELSVQPLNNGDNWSIKVDDNPGR